MPGSFKNYRSFDNNAFEAFVEYKITASIENDENPSRNKKYSIILNIIEPPLFKMSTISI